MTSGHLHQGGGVHLLPADDGHPGRRHGAKGRRPRAALEECALAEDRARPHLHDGVAVHLDAQHSVEQKKELAPRLSLLDERGTLLDAADPRLYALPHDSPRQLAFQRRLDLGDEGGGVGRTPRSLLRGGLAQPVLEIDESRLGNERTRAVVDPVAWEGACADHFVLAGAVGVDGESERRPGERRNDLREGLASHTARHGHAGSSTRRLDEPDPRGAALRLGPQVGKSHTGHREVLAAQAKRRGSDVPPSGLSVADDPAVLYVDPRSELVREPEAIGGAERLQIVEDVRRWLVMVSHPQGEGHLQHALDRLRRDPGNRGDRRLDAQRTGYPMGGWTLVMSYPVAVRIVPIL